MDCINELRDSLNVHLGWNKARITCFVNTGVWTNRDLIRARARGRARARPNPS